MTGWPPPEWFQQPTPANDGWGENPPAWVQDPTSQPTGMAEDVAGMAPSMPEPGLPDWMQALQAGVNGASQTALPEYARGPKAQPEVYPFGAAPELAGPPPKPMGMGAMPEPKLPPAPPGPSLPVPPAKPDSEGPPASARQQLGSIGDHAQGYGQSMDEAGEAAQRIGNTLADAENIEGGARKAIAMQALKQNDDVQRGYQQARHNAEQKAIQIDQEYQALAREKEDPGRWWSNAGMDQKFAAIAAAALHGWLNPGKPNQAVEIIGNLVQQDIAAQRADRQAKYASLDSRRGLLARADDLGKQDFEVESMLMLRGIDIYDKALAGQMQQVRSPVLREKAEQERAMLGAAKHQVLGGLAQQQLEMDLKQQALMARGGGRNGPAPQQDAAMDPLAVPGAQVIVRDADGNQVFDEREIQVDPIRDTRSKGKPIAVDKEGRRLFEGPGGKTLTEGVDVKAVQSKDEAGNVTERFIYTERVPQRKAARVGDKEDARKLRASIAGYRAYDQALGDVIAIGSREGWEALPSQEKARMSASIDEARAQLRVMLTMGALSEDEYKRLENQLPNPGDMGTWGSIDKLKAKRQAARKTGVNVLQSYGLEADEGGIYGGEARNVPKEVRLTQTLETPTWGRGVMHGVNPIVGKALDAAQGAPVYAPKVKP
jgi:hypothetical protein